MNRTLLALAGVAALAGAFGAGRASARALGGCSLIEHDSTVAASQPGPHRGTGRTTGYSFFARAPGLEMVFRKRALHPGASIGYHQQKEDEIYYVLSGRGELTLDGVRQDVGPGTAILTRPGSSHGLRQVGSEDLVIMISYLSHPRRAGAP